MKKDKVKKSTILVDIHNTILNGDKHNQIVIAALKGFAKIGYSIAVFTADRLEDPEKVKSKLLQIGVVFDKIYYPDHNASVFAGEDDAGIKEILYNGNIKESFDVKLLIDNSKDVCKLFNKKLKIPTMRFKEVKK